MREALTISVPVRPTSVALPSSERGICRHLDKTIAGGMLAALIFTTLANGAVEPWSIAVFELIVVVLLLLSPLLLSVESSALQPRCSWGSGHHGNVSSASSPPR